MNDEAVKALLDGATPGPWRADGEPWNRIVWSSADNRVCFMAHSSGLNDARDIATSNLIAAAPDLARALLDARAERDRVAAINVKHCEAVNTLLVDGARLEDRAKAAEAERDRLRDRERVLADFIAEFAAAKIDTLRYQPAYGESPEDAPDPVVEAEIVWAWQEDARAALAQPSTEGGE